MSEFCNSFEGLPDGISTETAMLCDEVTKKTGANDKITLATEVYKALAAKHRNGDLPQAMASLGIGTREDLLCATESFLQWRAANPAELELHDSEDAMVEQADAENISNSSISDITLFVIDNIVKRTKTTDRYDVMGYVCDVLEHRFGTGDKLEPNLKKLNLATTQDVLQAIDIYFVMKQLYPDTVFGRKRMQNVWNPSFQACLPVGEVS